MNAKRMLIGSLFGLLAFVPVASAHPHVTGVQSGDIGVYVYTDSQLEEGSGHYLGVCVDDDGQGSATYTPEGLPFWDAVEFVLGEDQADEIGPVIYPNTDEPSTVSPSDECSWVA